MSKLSPFTLIECLVVISIITILAALLLPALNTARAAAKDINCCSNFKQIGSAMFLYVDDNPNYIPADQAGATGIVPYATWQDMIYLYVYPNGALSIVPCNNYYSRNNPMWGRNQMPYGVFRCPSQTKYGIQYIYSHYGLNSLIVATGIYRNIGRVSSPSLRCLCMDQESSSSSDGSWISNDTSRWGNRHMNMQGVNVLYVDGHVAAMPTRNISRDGTSQFWGQNWTN